MPIHRRLPKRGFNNIFRKDYVEVNLGRLQAAIDAGKLDAGKPLDPAAMLAAGVVSKLRDGVRILAKGELTSKKYLSCYVRWNLNLLSGVWSLELAQEKLINFKFSSFVRNSRGRA